MARPWRDIGRYGSAGIEFLLTILVLSYLGHWLDLRYGLRGWGLPAGFLLGTAVAFRNLLRLANRIQRDIERAEARDPQASRWTVDQDWIHKEESDPVRRSDPTARPNDARPFGDNEESDPVRRPDSLASHEGKGPTKDTADGHR